jgi:hypothetical protein
LAAIDDSDLTAVCLVKKDRKGFAVGDAGAEGQRITENQDASSFAALDAGITKAPMVDMGERRRGTVG